MSTLNELVREQILAEGPEYLDGDAKLQDEYVDEQLNAMTNVELLERISDVLRKDSKTPTTKPEKGIVHEPA